MTKGTTRSSTTRRRARSVARWHLEIDGIRRAEFKDAAGGREIRDRFSSPKFDKLVVENLILTEGKTKDPDLFDLATKAQRHGPAVVLPGVVVVLLTIDGKRIARARLDEVAVRDFTGRWRVLDGTIDFIELSVASIVDEEVI
jgi:hypothetical protein